MPKPPSVTSRRAKGKRLGACYFASLQAPRHFFPGFRSRLLIFPGSDRSFTAPVHSLNLSFVSFVRSGHMERPDPVRDGEGGGGICAAFARAPFLRSPYLSRIQTRPVLSPAPNEAPPPHTPAPRGSPSLSLAQQPSKKRLPLRLPAPSFLPPLTSGQNPVPKWLALGAEVLPYPKQALTHTHTLSRGPREAPWGGGGGGVSTCQERLKGQAGIWDGAQWACVCVGRLDPQVIES